MARRSKAQIQADKIIKGHLEKIGKKMYFLSKKYTRVQTGRLKKSINYRVEKDTQLIFTQQAYGKDVHPTKQYDKGEPDAMLQAIKELLPAGIEVIKKDIKESILYPFKNRK
jgi:hypothetical protein